MEQEMVLFSKINPMMDDVKVVARCVRLWKSHSPGKPNAPYGLDAVLMDPEGNRIQAAVGTESINKFMAVLEEGKCYKFGNIGVDDNGGKYPLLNHPYKINFYNNTTVTRINDFDQNLRGFNFERFENLKVKKYVRSDVVDLIPFEHGGKEKKRRTVILQDVEGNQLECCFYEAWAEKFNTVYANQNESKGPVVMILQLARVKYFNEQATVTNGFYATKLYLNDKIPEILAFTTRFQEMDGYDAKDHAISVYSPVAKKEVTVDDFFVGCTRKMVGRIRESGYEYDCIVYGKIYKIHREYGWTFIGCKVCSTAVKPADSGASSKGSSSKIAMAKKKMWTCKKCPGQISAVGPKYKVIIRIIDDTGSATLLLYDNMIVKLFTTPCYKLKEKYGVEQFPDELINNIVGKRMLFRFKYSEHNINENNHVYTVLQMSDDAEFIKKHKKDFIFEDNEVLSTPTNTFQTPVGQIESSTSKFRYQEMVPFNIDDTPKSVKANPSVNGSSENGDIDTDVAKKVDSSESDGSSGKGKRVVIDLDTYDEEAAAAKRGEQILLLVKLEKE